MIIKPSYRWTTATLQLLQHKWVFWLWNLEKTDIKWDVSSTFNKNLDIYLFDYPPLTRRVIKFLYQPGVFFGLAAWSYYSGDFSKKRKLTTKNFYKLKLSTKWDGKFFFGLLISRHLNFLSSTVKIRNVFYNEIIEKTFFLFNNWNSLVGNLQNTKMWHFLAFFLKNRRRKKKFLSIRQHPRVISWIVLLD